MARLNRQVPNILGTTAVVALLAACSSRPEPESPSHTGMSPEQSGYPEQPAWEGDNQGLQPGTQQPGMQQQPGDQQPGMQQQPGAQQPGMQPQPGTQQPETQQPGGMAPGPMPPGTSPGSTSPGTGEDEQEQEQGGQQGEEDRYSPPGPDGMGGPQTPGQPMQ